VRTPLLLFGLALAVRAGLMLIFPDPAYPDAYYYVDVARALANGHGLNVDFVWIFAEVGGKLPAQAVLPVPSNAHWLPLASFLQVPFILLLGANAIASALPLVLVGSLAAPLTWAIARDIGASRTVQVGAGVLAAIPAAATVFMPQPENFAIFQPLIAATLWMTARGLRGDTRSYAVAGLLVGLASIARNDAFLLGLAVGLVFVIDRIRAWRHKVRPHIPFLAAVACVGLYLLVVVPWWYRQLTVFGSISPTASNGTALWLTDYRQWDSITADVSFSNFLAQGLDGIIGSRVGGFVSAAANFAVLVGSLVLVPFMIWGGWLRRRSDDLLPWFLYLVILFLGATLIFPLHVPGGAFIHSAVGLGPYAYILALEGVAAFVVWIARRRPTWDTASAIPTFSWIVVGLVVISAVLVVPVLHAGWNAVREPRLEAAARLDALGVPATDRLMTVDAGGFKYLTGRGGVVTPDDPIDTIRDVAEAYDIRWLILEKKGVVEALEPVIDGESRPSWIGAPALVVASDAGAPILGLYPVCFGTDDTRCQGTV
jgi:Dolichyl-phosphate-mannose-protein mannosyltransferase